MRKREHNNLEMLDDFYCKDYFHSLEETDPEMILESDSETMKSYDCDLISIN